jgi:DNA modification methylase
MPRAGKLPSKLTVVNRSPAELSPDPKNPRNHKPRQVRAIAQSIERFGFNVPVIIDAENRIIAGHGRVLAAQKLGLAEVPTVRIEHLTPAEARAFQIADNKLTENAGWNKRLLGEVFQELSVLDLDFDLEITGFSIGEIDLLIDVEDLKPEHDKADDPPVAEGSPVTAPGDLWKLGEHRLLCANALDPDSYRMIMPGEFADMVFTDPPYNVSMRRYAGGLGSSKPREFAMAAGEMTEPEFQAFLARSLELIAAHSKDPSLHYICMDWRHIHPLLAAASRVYMEHKNICVWEKENAGMGSFYRGQHEFISVHQKGRGPARNNIQLGRNGRHRTNVWRYPGSNGFSRNTEEGNLLSLHPTVKPVALVADAILDATARGDLVLDAFAGSGSTLIAAERVGRRCAALEIDPLYVDTAIRRWQIITGGTARHARSGLSFNATTHPGGPKCCSTVQNDIDGGENLGEE